MKKIYVLFLIVLYVSGCATTQPDVLDGITPESVVTEEEEILTIVPTEEEEVVVPEEEILMGYLFAKVSFEGILDTAYVKLNVENDDDENNKFQLHVGDDLNQPNYSWEIKKIQQGYFLIEIPEGNYKITSITIPVGSTVASEGMDVSFKVEQDKVAYGGDIVINGTKERIKLGGVPVIKPGFEYKIEIADQVEEAEKIFFERYPESKKKINLGLMEVGIVEAE